MFYKASTSLNYLLLSQRIARIILGTILIVVVTTEAALTMSWLLVLSAIALYAMLTGFSGWEPLLQLLKLSHPQLPDHKLSLTPQFECAVFGMIFVLVGVLYRGSDSILLRLLPFLGIYPILICAIKHDLLAYVLQSYRRGLATGKMDCK